MEEEAVDWFRWIVLVELASLVTGTSKGIEDIKKFSFQNVLHSS